MDEMNQLAQLWKLPTGAFLQGMGAMENARAADDEALKQSQLKTMFSQQNDPQRLREQDLQNQTLEAQLPGVVANSSLNQDRAKFSKATNDTAIDDFLKSSKDKVGAQHLKRLTDATQAYGLAGGAMNSIPPAARHAYARQMMGEFYNPELFDRVPPEALPKMLQTMASESTTFSQKVQAKLQEQAALAQYRSQLQAQKDAAAGERARVLAAAKAAVKQAATTKDPATLEGLAVRLKLRAMDPTTDLETQQALLEAASEAIKIKDQLAKNAAAARGAADPAIAGAAGLPTKGNEAAPQFTPPKAATPPADAVADRPNRQNKTTYPDAPDLGTKKGGYEYLGGPPDSPSSWKKL